MHKIDYADSQLESGIESFMTVFVNRLANYRKKAITIEFLHAR
jgi:hypothetical protein